MKALERLEDKKEIKKIFRGMGESALWFLKDAPVPRGNFKHLNSCSDLFVSLFPMIESWEWERQGKNRPDRIAILGGNKVYFEIDRGTEKYDDISRKLDAYVSHYKETKEDFIVIFTVEDYADPFGKVRTSAKTRGAGILERFTERKLPGNFYVCRHEQIAQDPSAPLVSRFQKTALKELLKPV